MKKFILLSILGIVFHTSSQAQIDAVFAGRDDASTYVQHYLNPVMNGLMYNLNNGWYTTGKTHKKFGFDLTISASAAMIPDDEKMFQFVASDYNYLSVASGPSEIPTLAGGESTTQLEATNNGDSILFDAPDGAAGEWPEDFILPVSVPTPMVQLGLGLPTKTDLKLRFFPNTNRDGVSFKLLGVGLQHDLTQHFKVLDDMSNIRISALGAFTRASIVYSPEDSDIGGNDQRTEMKINTYTVQAIGDINLKIINFYLGIGYTGGKTSLDALGSYEFDYDDDGTIDQNDEVIVDPISLNFAISGIKTTLGARLNLGPVKIFADYSLQKYSSITAGIAISVR